MIIRHKLPALLAFSATLWAGTAAASNCPEQIGTICANGAEVTVEEMLAQLKAADVTLIGERHDNPAHHEWQARITGALAPLGLVVEMVPTDREDAANTAVTTGGDLKAALDWDASGWPDWSMYEPIFNAAPNAKIAGAGAPRDQLRASVGQGAADVLGSRAAKLGLDKPLPEDVMADMVDEQDRAHCGALPEVMLPGMVEAQRYRDGLLAEGALRLAEESKTPIVIIAGNGHTRTDRGAPFYLKQALPDQTILSVGVLEAGNSPAGVPFDFVIWTEKHDRGDPCEAFIKSRQNSD
ncbi:MAG: ChaN family lipoprotein [Pikeienuella sp.]